MKFALAMAPEPKLLFLDEPTAGMNPVERVKVLENIRRLSKEKQSTFVIVEHDMDIVFKISQKIRVLCYGSLLAEGTPAEISNNEKVIEAYLGEEV